MVKSVLIMAGGTGGHVFPALATAEEFTVRGFKVHWLGTPRGIENELVEAAGYRLHHIQIGGLRGKAIGSLLKAPWQLLRALWQARALIKQLRPHCVLGFGGYVTGPGGLAAWLSRVPLIIHEQNAVMGTSNRLLARFARGIALGFPKVLGLAEKYQGKCRTIGNPLRKTLTSIEPRPITGAPHLLVLGGSLGAESINQLLPEALALLPAKLRPKVKHQAGRAHAEKTEERYKKAGISAEVLPFIADMASHYAWADLLIARAGALTVSELAAAAKAALLIPLPQAIDDHQTQNARFLSEAGAARLLVQSQTTGAVLAAQLGELLAQPQILQRMGQNARQCAKPCATKALVDYCLTLSSGETHAKS
ncbi:UDP-N-acetylglucosamine--N-acetylmuramyl-(pentapeptide) pyrophosphoryl-undecaprenol N-acetylglucosamine transferase [Ventosimonas gracilis]|uniref:UDP-N-acetylglucosamine--N-acetylmuramyl-(pentapeptide) pyrophosphoryl-undecaprenol N-acetylglucosamine transferase n=1 Tax=Ventosimonas gracilis TaxID=1680762 RepID=A0A139SUX3_9GAMM|nr:undecaprenyldiphospho-muramoylpentapeptide beta-N-acetylglucosaminyltransferase [Ventosimonas gracilis]KXU38406.1 UDP-N-acetylglucosamine--N-acetylmuramyl-(pentapeptide) pyrophosphoryl-undecaprenol N-acetylglucosamine transferase [Ventosimonas gracilis]